MNDGSRRADIVRDIKIGYLRAFLIEALIKEATETFIEQKDAIMTLTHNEPIMEASPLCKKLKGIAQQYAFSHRNVLKTEAMGAVAIDKLMSEFWNAIHTRTSLSNILSKRIGARARFVYSLISPNYLEEAERSSNRAGDAGSIRYRELRLLTDMVSGMTDTFAIKLWQELESMPDVCCT